MPATISGHLEDAKIHDKEGKNNGFKTNTRRDQNIHA